MKPRLGDRAATLGLLSVPSISPMAVNSMYRAKYTEMLRAAHALEKLQVHGRSQCVKADGFQRDKVPWKLGVTTY